MLLEDFNKRVQKENLGVYNTYVYQNGKVIDKSHFRADERVNIWSGTKTFTSMAVGIAIDKGLLTVEDKVLDFFPEYKTIATPNSDKITIKNLLNMSSGHSGNNVTSDEYEQDQNKDWAHQFFELPVDKVSGEHYNYENGCSYMLGRVVHKLTGQNLRDYLMPRLFKPLDIPYVNWHTCPQGHSIGAFSLYLRAEEFMRLGVLLLGKGVYNGKQIVSEAYVNQAVNDRIKTTWDDKENLTYGYQLWWNSYKNTYRADGKYGQFSIVMPDQNAVIAITSHNETYANAILDAVWEEVAGRL